MQGFLCCLHHLINYYQFNAFIKISVTMILFEFYDYRKQEKELEAMSQFDLDHQAEDQALCSNSEVKSRTE